jgi:transcription elongation factor/antiterminator RfaH
MDLCDRWYAVQTKPRCEDQAVAWLERRTRASIYLPKLESVRRRRGHKVHVVEPLFPSYLFVHMPMVPEQWHAVKWTPGVKDFVTSGGIPVPVPDEAIGFLQTQSLNGVIRVSQRWHSGMVVRITTGPFTGLIGVLDRPTSRAERVRVLLRLMRTVAAIEVETVDLEEVVG